MASPTQIDQRELAEAPASWRRWWRCRGRLVVMPDGSLDMAPGARWTRHERDPQPQKEKRRAA